MFAGKVSIFFLRKTGHFKLHCLTYHKSTILPYWRRCHKKRGENTREIREK